MIFSQPVFCAFPNLKVPTVLMIGDMDATAIGADAATPEVKTQLGLFDVLGKRSPP
ncbi:hypothetical protein M2321_004028 [Rhodoblastus acidophilus]|nr:hypothetical protein [Rhodoblastus acidophilus]